MSDYPTTLSPARALTEPATASRTAATGLGSIGLVVLRVIVGVTFAMHGYQVLFGGAAAGMIEGFTGLGIPLPAFAVYATAVLQLAGGIALALGLLTRVLGVLLAANMVGALVMVHLPAGFFVDDGGVELVLLLAGGAATLALTGAGAYSIDALASRAWASRRESRTV